ncbi:MAG: mechanosensitive ion channel domain-containing protein [Zymomonas mobilis subsp. pomaceae]|nr:mechanosensitive ion channel domain-containing protein [Zymomonas mobilis]MDX5948291.1 mechanosensitive ion channel [Zymomonas mobilis subsp. pomaceae]
MKILPDNSYFQKIRSISLFLFFLLLFINTITAQAIAADNNDNPPAAPSDQASLSKSEAQRLLQTLENPKKREAFAHTLSLMTKALPSDHDKTHHPSETSDLDNTVEADNSVTNDSVTENNIENNSTQTVEKPAAAPVAPSKTSSAEEAVDNNEPAIIINKDVGDDLNVVSRYIVRYSSNFASLFKDMGFVARWFRVEMSNPVTHKILVNAVVYGTFIFLLGLALEYATAFLTRGLLRTIKSRAQSYETQWNFRHLAHNDSDDTSQGINPVSEDNIDSDDPDPKDIKTREEDHRRQHEVMAFIIRVPFTFYHMMIKLLPVALLVGFSYIASALFSPSRQAEALTLTLANAYSVSRIVYIILESTFAPASPPIRIFPASDYTAKLVIRWANILVFSPAVIIFITSMGSEFHLARRGIEAIVLAVILIEHLLLAAFIWRIRHIVGRALQPPEKMRGSVFWGFVSTIVGLWWIPAIFVDMALWLIWATRLHNGYKWMLRSCILTIAILIFSRLFAVLAYGAQENLFNLKDETKNRYPRLQKRADFYYPYVHTAITVIITFVSLVALTQSWGIPTIRFLFKSSIGARLTGLAFSMLIAITIAAALWEFVNALLNRQIDRFHETNQFSRATRLRTVLPIIRTVLLVFIVIIVAVTTLSQIGINVAPLLTGAGIMGAAIAFGSQSLVKDFITGFFMLVEDAIQVGDWVTTGGVSGTVEHLSIRTLRVRAINGDLHIIPFSSVTSIANTGRDFNQIIIRQTLDLSEDSSRVVKIMQQTIDEMRKEDNFKDIIYSGYNDLGVDNTDGSGAILVGTIRTAAMMKWKIQREFYRRLANRMAKAQVKFYTGTSYYTTPPGSPLHWINDQPDVPTSMQQAEEGDNASSGNEDGVQAAPDKGIKKEKNISLKKNDAAKEAEKLKPQPDGEEDESKA